MSLNPAELALVAQELTQGLGGGVVQKAYAPSPGGGYLEVRQSGRTVLLCLSALPATGRLSVARHRPPSPEEALPFQRWLRQELIGARLVRVEAIAGRRRAVLRLDRSGRLRSLWLEIGGRGGLVLTSEGERILAMSAAAGGGLHGLRPGATLEWGEPAPGEAPPRTERLAPTPDAAFPWAEAAETLLGDKEQVQRAEAVRRALQAPLKARLSRLERTLEKVRLEAARQPEAEEHRKLGELLARNLHRIARGATSVRVTEYGEAGPSEREIALDPARSPREQVERHFHQYRRLMRGCEHARARIEVLSQEREQLLAQLAQLEALSGPELPSASPRPPPTQRRAPVSRPFREYRSLHGEPIWVGKNAEGNDRLTFRLARPDDLWLHARGVPGSHVVVPLAKGAAVGQELLLDAAHLALFHSALKGEPRGEVSYTPVKFVRKPKGGAPGQVLYSREKTFLVRVEPARLERVLRSQVE